MGEKAPTTKQRGEKIKELLKASFNAPKKTFHFTLGKNTVCERSFLVALGLITRENAPKQWTNEKAFLKTGLPPPKKQGVYGPVTFKAKKQTKFEHAIVYIKFIAKTMSDCSVYDENVQYLPYETAEEFFREYDAGNDAELINITLRAGLRQFERALESLKDVVKLLRAKGKNHLTILLMS